MNLFAAQYADRLAAWSDIQTHLPFLHERASQSKTILELGVRGGISTAALLAGVESQVQNGHLWSVDIEMPHVPNRWFGSPLWTFTLGDDMAPEIAACQPQQIDMLVIDTSHFYEHTLAELRLYVPRVNKGGMICCHDTELEYVPGRHPNGYESFSVSRALETFCGETGLHWENRTGSYGLGVIKIP